MPDKVMESQALCSCQSGLESEEFNISDCNLNLNAKTVVNEKAKDQKERQKQKKTSVVVSKATNRSKVAKKKSEVKEGGVESCSKKNPSVTSENKNCPCVTNGKFCEENIVVGPDGKKYHYSRIFKGSATAYTSEKENSKTATGKIPKPGMVAVNPKDIPYGSEVIAKFGNGTVRKFKAEDTGGALRRGKCVLDIYMDEVADCKKFGRQKVDVYLI
ncbi:MAG: 3D domain-containing protein [Oscillospiraceae bacterium]|nr:3D domain-containing protein [Oscillospiraceae bacterium]